MKKLHLAMVALIPVVGWALPLQFNAQTTNNSVLYWQPWTNGVPLRYTFYWTSRSNADTGTNWATTTNWSQVADVNSSTTNASLAHVPTNTYITGVITVPGGRTTLPMISNSAPYTYLGYPGVGLTNQPVAP